MFASVVCVNFVNETQIRKFVKYIAVKFSICFIRKGMVMSGINDVRRRCTVCGEKTRDRMVCQDL